jgi:hypothetical protein
MWVSAYPWGWMPYRYGSWAFVPGFGWVWQPGLWNTWYAVPRVVNPPRRTLIPQPPVRSKGTVMVGRGLVVNPPARPPRRLTINPGSAGLGVPRGSVRNLDRFAREMNRSDRPVAVRTEAPSQRSMRDADSGMTNSRPTAGSSGSSAPTRETSTPRMTTPSAPPARSSKPH